MSHMRREGDKENQLETVWLKWLRAHCTVEGHGAHMRNDCFESLEQALHGCVVMDVPTD